MPESSLPQPPESDRVMDLLQRHVPLSLICDLALSEDPRSAEIYLVEGLVEEDWQGPVATSRDIVLTTPALPGARRGDADPSVVALDATVEAPALCRGSDAEI